VAFCCFIILSVDFGAHDGKVAFRRLQWIGFEGEINRGYVNRGFKLCSRLPRRVFVLDRLVGGGEDHLESQARRRGSRVHRWPTWLVNDGTLRLVFGAAKTDRNFSGRNGLTPET
jgi:hypothetical protein